MFCIVCLKVYRRFSCKCSFSSICWKPTLVVSLKYFLVFALFQACVSYRLVSYEKATTSIAHKRPGPQKGLSASFCSCLSSGLDQVTLASLLHNF